MRTGPDSDSKYSGTFGKPKILKMGKEHLEQMYFAFTAGFVRFRSAAEAPGAKSELAGQVEGYFGHFFIFFPLAH